MTVVYFMKLAVVVICAVLARGSLAQDTTPSVTEPTPSPWFQCPSSEGFFPNPYNCSSYFHCTNGLPWMEACSAGLYFNPATQRCDWPQNVQCSPLTTSVAPMARNNKDLRFSCPSPNGLFPHPDCSKYYNCGNNIAYEMSCPAGQLFDLSVTSCNHAFLTDCGDRYRPGDSSNPTTGSGSGSTVAVTTRPPVGGNTTYTCPNPWGVFPHPECNKYYTCEANVPYVMHCRDNLVFDLVYNGCNYPEYTDCGDRIRPESNSTVPSTQRPPTGNATFNCPTPNGVFPHENCEKYYTCTNGAAYVMTCRDNLLFDLVYAGCNYPEYMDCGDRIRPGSNSTSSSTTTQKPPVGGNTTYSCPNPWGVFPHPDCEKYYTCEDNVPYVMHCRDNQLFDLVYNGCNYPEYTDCGNRTRPAGSPTTTARPTTTRNPTSPGGDQFVCPGDGLFADPKDCAWYYNCGNGNAWHMYCGDGFHFHPTGKYCDWAANVPCSVRNSQAGAKTAGIRNLKARVNRRKLRDIDLGLAEFDCPSDGVFPHPECDKYYTCWNNEARLYKCIDNQVFDLVYMGCNYPDLTDCGNRTIPGGDLSTTSRGTTVTTTSVVYSTDRTRTTPAVTTESPNGNFSCPQPDGFFPQHPGACSSDYYICVDGQAYLTSCPSGSLFDPVTLVCTPNSAHCQGTTETTTRTTRTSTEHTTPPTTTSSSGFHCPSDGLFPNPESCESYYICSNGDAVLDNCPPGLFFSPSSGICDWPENVPECSSLSKNNQGSYRAVDINLGQVNWTCVSDGIFPHDECDKYVNCFDNVATLFKCGDNQLFDLSRSSCNAPQQVDCGNRTHVSGTTLAPSPTAEDSLFDCPATDGFFPIPGQCGPDYYVCIDRVVYNATCPGNSIFDPDTMVCSKPENVMCARVTTEAPFSCPETDGFFPLKPGLCSQDYYTCVQHVPYPNSCPNGTLFDPVLLKCVSWNACGATPTVATTPTPTNATTIVSTSVVPVTNSTATSSITTANRTTVSTSTTTRTTTPVNVTSTTPVINVTESYSTISSSAPSTVWTTTPAPSTFPNCTKFTCTGTSTASTTANTTTPSSTTRPTNATTVTTTPTTTTTSRGPFSCPSSDGLFPNPDSCRSYYVCANGIPTLTNCPNGLYFNPAIQACDWPYNVPSCSADEEEVEQQPQLKEQKTMEMDSNDINLGEVEWDCPSDGLFPHPECNKYYSCWNSVAILFQCSDDLVFDLRYNGCNYLDLTDCGNRTLPNGTVTTSTTRRPPLSTTPRPNFNCPESEGFFAIPGECSEEYYVCVDGVASVASCPAGSIFDPDRLICANPNNVACAQITTTTEASFSCPQPDGFFPLRPDACDKSYYTCVAGTPYVSECPGTSLFDPVLLKCVAAADCGALISTTPVTTEEPFVCPEADGFFPLRPDGCYHSYYTCVAGQPYHSECPGETQFDPVLLRCVTAASCGSQSNATTSSTAAASSLTPIRTTRPASASSTAESDTTLELTSSSPFRCPATDGSYPHPNDCNQYYVCTIGIPFLSTCPTGLYFNPATSGCDWPASVPTCVNRGPGDVDLGEVDWKCPANGVFPHPECDKYYSCYSDVAHLFRCRDDLLFDLVYYGCNYKDLTDCGNRTRPGETTTPVVTPPIDFQCPSDGFFAIPDACSPDYYVCVDGKPSVATCPPGAIFDPDRLLCVNADDVPCTHVTTTTEAPFSCPDSDGFFAIDSDLCQKEYYTCVADTPYLTECPGTSVFDPNLGRCVAPADCTVEVAPTPEPTAQPTGTTRTTQKTTTGTGQPFVCPPTDGSYPDPNSCENYYVCTNGNAIFSSCPDGLFFNPSSSLCDWPWNVPSCQQPF